MPYVRVSLMQPKLGQQAHVRKLLDDLAGFFAMQPGFVEGYKLDSAEDLVGRITVWESEASADHAAQNNHVLSLRSELNPVVVDGSHQEHAFDGTYVKATS